MPLIEIHHHAAAAVPDDAVVLADLDRQIEAERGQTRAADQKAGLLTTGLVPTVAAAAVAGAFAKLPPAAAVLGWGAAAVALAAVVLLGVTVWPRTRVHETAGPEGLLAAAEARAVDVDAAKRERAAELALLLRIVATKWRLYRWALSATGAAVVLAAAAFVLSVAS